MKDYKPAVIKMIRFCIKPLSFLPAIFMMCLIFGFSAQDAQASGQLSNQVTVKLVEACESVFARGWSDLEITQYALMLEHAIRKAAHMAEYFILAVTVALPLYGCRLRGWRPALAAAVFCTAFACLDEYHQSFVPGRFPSLRDVCIDAAGSLAGVCAANLLRMLGERVFSRALSRRVSRTG